MHDAQLIPSIPKNPNTISMMKGVLMMYFIDKTLTNANKFGFSISTDAAKVTGIGSRK